MSVATFDFLLTCLFVVRCLIGSVRLVSALAIAWFQQVSVTLFQLQHVLSTNGRRTGGNNDCISLHDEKQIGSSYLVHPIILCYW